MDEDSTNYLALQAAQSVNLAEIEIRDQLNDGKDKITLTDAVLGDDSLDVLFKLLAQKRCVIHSLDLGNSNVSDDGLRKLVGMHLSELLLGESRRLTGNSIQSIVRAGST
jgi:hypothetical protein